ncbi:MAG: cobalamin B12-binding domain-containing protein [Candidatus Omnitrophica bacterium]|nr:cobalamin B12-binding domain-containing protein [Candidatus Omnitrophota bacterium]
MKVTLLYPPIPAVTTSVAPPVGLAYLASVLCEKEAQVSVVSSTAEGLGVEDTLARILEISPDAVGISITTPTVNNSLEIVEKLKKSKKKPMIFVGGPHPTLFPEEFLNKGVDFVVRGEGEATLSELYDAMKNNTSCDDIKGISFKKERRFTHNPDRELIKDLDTLNFPKWDLFPVRKYESDFRIKDFSMPILSSRGCPAQCTFCYKGIFGDMFRTRSPLKIVDEIEFLKQKFNIEEFAIIDDSFTSKPKRAMEVCDLIVSRGINLPWSLPAGIRVSTVSAELLKKLKAAGCYRVGLGIESGSQSILNSIKKGITLEQARKAVKLLKEARMESAGYFMIGNLGETEKTINSTIDFAIELNPDYAQFTKATPYPGTAMYDQLKTEDRILTENWDDYDSFLKSRPVFKHENLTSEAIDQKLKEAYRKFYYRPGQMVKYLRAIKSAKEVRNFFKNALKFFKTYST